MTTLPLPYKNSEKPGSYHLITRLGNSNLNPGNTLKFDQYITGYGTASGLKIAVYPSSDIFNLELSTIKKGLRFDEGSGLSWGTETIKMSQVGMALNLGTHNHETWKNDSYFFDTVCDGKSLSVCTELDLGGHPPFSYTLITDKKKSKPGAYCIVFVLTYFDGEQWNTKEEKINFKINNSFERYSSQLSALAAIALFVTIVTDGALPLIDLLFPDDARKTANLVINYISSLAQKLTCFLSNLS